MKGWLTELSEAECEIQEDVVSVEDAVTFLILAKTHLRKLLVLTDDLAYYLDAGYENMTVKKWNESREYMAKKYKTALGDG